MPDVLRPLFDQVVFLASPEATMASGTVIDVNGASYLRM
jgi:hypothetical protein